MKNFSASLLDRPVVAGSSSPTRRAPRPQWSPWPIVSRPATTADEQRFVRALTEAGARGDLDALSEFGRTDVTLLLNALRCGLTVRQLTQLAPGMDATRLLAAYVGLDAARLRSVNGWRAITGAAEVRPDVAPDARTAATLAALGNHAAEAAKLLPTKVVRLVALAKERPSDVADAAHRAAVEVSVQAAHVQRIEAAIERATLDYPPGSQADEWAAELGALLYDPFGDAVANRPDFLPERVGLLNPTRVAALLGERPGPQVG